ncbi:MtrAB system histidine kinase MtrB [Arthrobacter yangruifuii]|uniref:MtrAB system histidine kinase MtrB n=1 Tax=Arthrobacter yangruifuii TaxID=2606616 RepID=UPI001FE3C829|nr:MtrAB system histidine kinase MtrB [Arthrobacter yangruifuii]
MAGNPKYSSSLQALARHGDAFNRAIFHRIARQWRRSLQFKTVVSTLLLVALAGAGIGAFLSHQIAGSLYEERLAQFRTEATTGLSKVKDNFRDTAASDRESTDRLVMDTLPLLQGQGADAQRTYLLTPLPTDDPLYITSSVNSGTITANGIPVALSETVAASEASESDADYVFWSPLELASGEPGIAFGTKVTLPPDSSEYALYLIYDLQSMQETLDKIHGILWIAGFLLLAISGTIAWIVAKAGLGAVSDAAAVSEKLAAGELQERMEVKGEDEVARLAASFNHMAGTLQDQITQLATLSRMQQVFVSDVSHELRTPLTTVRMAAEVLYDARESFDPMYRRSTELLYHQVERFQALLADLLEISRFDAGAAALDLEPTDVFHIVRDVIDATEPLANNCGSEVIIVSREASCVVDADPRRIERILRNLLVNALEHGEGEPIEIAIAASDDAVGIAVRDHGIGMTEEDAGHVFDRFWRADPARARTTGGSGLGLSIATEDTRLHGGRLEAWGEPGNGSCFRLTLPRRHGAGFEASPVPLSPRENTAGPLALAAAAPGREEEPDA